uniref:RNA ligase 1 n=1 Tax=Cyprinus carpio TaxID=7962 RepID=A0A8C1UEY2_CYPCA
MRVFINIIIFFFEGEPYLWARLDRKPTKQADKRFKKYQYSQKTCKGFVWNVDEDFREVPESWIAAHRVQHENGHPVPDEHGHTPGWVPVDHTNKQYCWHASVVNYDAGVALVLKTHREDEGLLEIISLGSKKHPVHVLVPHGVLRIRNPPPVEFQQLYSWFQERQEGRVEGIVWHCDDGTLVKIHRHHLGLKWPVGDTFLNTRPVVVHVDETPDPDASEKDLFKSFSSINGKLFSCIRDIPFEPIP